jgi:hypothetical protein
MEALMSSHENDSKQSIISRYSKIDVDRPLPESIVVEDQSPPRRNFTAERAYEKFLARGREHGHDVDDWIESEAEISREDRQLGDDAISGSPQSPRDHHSEAHLR